MILAVAVPLNPVAHSASTPVVLVDGVELACDVPPQIIAGTVMACVRTVAAALSAQATYHAASRTLSVTDGATALQFHIGSKIAILNQEGAMLPLAPYLLGDRVMVPLLFLGQAFGASPSWDTQTLSVSMTSVKPEVVGLDWHLEAGAAQLRIGLSKAARHRLAALADPPRLVLDLDGVIIGAGVAGLAPGQALVSRVDIAGYDGDPPGTRITVDCAEPLRYDLGVEDGGRTLILALQYKVTDLALAYGQVAVKATGPLNFHASVSPDPGRLVVDIHPATMGGPVRELTGDGARFRRVRLFQLNEAPDIVRLEIETGIPELLEVLPAGSGLAVGLAGGTLLETVSYRRQGDIGRVSLALGADTVYSVRREVSPRRLVVDLTGPGKMRAAPLRVRDGIVKDVAIAHTSDGTRVTIELAAHVWHRVAELPGNGVALDIQASPIRGKTILVDPGHGGLDPGAVAPGAIYEKQITLSVAKLLQGLLQEAGATVLMTRAADVWVAERERVAMANMPGIDAVLSLHCNGYVNRGLSGTETYYYVATNQSKRLAQSIHSEVVRAVRFPDRGVRVKNFLIVKYVEPPAALLEMLYLSNAQDRAYLMSAAGQRTLAQAACRGLLRFFGWTPPVDTP